MLRSPRNVSLCAAPYRDLRRGAARLINFILRAKKLVRNALRPSTGIFARGPPSTEAPLRNSVGQHICTMTLISPLLMKTTGPGKNGIVKEKEKDITETVGHVNDVILHDVKGGGYERGKNCLRLPCTSAFQPPYPGGQ